MANPKKIVAAFVPVGSRIGEFTPGRMLVLERIGHPLVADQKPEAARELTNEEVLQGMFVLSAGIKQLHALLSAGLPAFQAAVYEYADTLKLADMPEYGRQMRESLERALSTMVGNGAANSGGAEDALGEAPPPATLSPATGGEATGSGGT